MMLPLQALPIVELFFDRRLEIRNRMNFYSIIGSSMRTKLPLSRRITLASAILSVLLLVLLMIAVVTGAWRHRYPSMEPSHFGMNNNGTTLSAHHRRLLRHATKEVVEPNRIWGDKCSKSDIVINQGPTAPLPSGIPTYTVEIMNVCVNGCDIRDIHLSCGWFSSARLINPRVFKRLRYNDCLVNNGKPLINGGTISFQYANTFSYPLSVASLVC